MGGGRVDPALSNALSSGLFLAHDLVEVTAWPLQHGFTGRKGRGAAPGAPVTALDGHDVSEVVDTNIDGQSGFRRAEQRPAPSQRGTGHPVISKHLTMGLVRGPSGGFSDVPELERARPTTSPAREAAWFPLLVPHPERPKATRIKPRTSRFIGWNCTPWSIRRRQAGRERRRNRALRRKSGWTERR